MELWQYQNMLLGPYLTNIGDRGKTWLQNEWRIVQEVYIRNQGTGGEWAFNKWSSDNIRIIRGTGWSVAKASSLFGGVIRIVNWLDFDQCKKDLARRSCCLCFQWRQQEAWKNNLYVGSTILILSILFLMNWFFLKKFYLENLQKIWLFLRVGSLYVSLCSLWHAIEIHSTLFLFHLSEE
jgi:hypothetical protein